MSTEAKVEPKYLARRICCQRCGQYLFTLKLKEGLSPDDVFIEAPCPICGKTEPEIRRDNPLALLPVQQKEVTCPSCKKHLCKIKSFREFYELGLILEVDKIKCPHCKCKDSFRIFVAPKKNEVAANGPY